MDLTGQTALITGSSKNIGRAIAVRMAQQGATVGITAHSDREGCEETLALVEEAGSSGSIAIGDIGNPDDITRMVSDIREDLGPIDTLVNNASIRPAKEFEEITLEDWDRVHNVNARSILLFAQEVLPDMREVGHGSIVNLHGEIIYRGSMHKAHVAASKSAAMGLTLSLASRFGPENIRANGVAPGRAIKTDRDTGNYPGWETQLRNIVDATPMRRRGEPEEIADVCCFLCSQEASFVTGQIIQVNGGLFPTIHLKNVGSEDD